jgi:hypothetical protein
MQTAVWKSLLRRVPEPLHASLMVMTAAGTEVNIQTIVHMDEDVLVLRGRLAGSTDMGRIFFIPYEGLDHVGFYKEVADASLREILGLAPPVAPAAVSAPVEAAAPAAPPPSPSAATAEPPAVATPATTADAGKDSSPRVRLPSKGEILERLRLRTAARAAEEQKT